MPREEEEIQDANAVEPLDFWISLSPHRRRPCVLNAGALRRVYSPASEPEGCSGPVQAPQGTSSSALKARILFILFSLCQKPPAVLWQCVRPAFYYFALLRPLFLRKLFAPGKTGGFFRRSSKKAPGGGRPSSRHPFACQGQGPPSPTRYPAVFPRL